MIGEFFDLTELDAVDNVELTPTMAEKHPANPVLPLGAHGEFDAKRAGNWAGDIHWDPDARQYRSWYYASDLEGMSAIGYATSPDGVMWEKPRLGRHEYAGSRDNNIVFLAQHSQTSHFCLFVDPDAEPERRYQALGWSSQPGIEGMRNYPYYSADGIDWEVTSTPENAVAIGDTSSILLDHQETDPQRKIKVYTQHGVWFGPDLEHLQEAPQLAINPADGREQEIHFISVVPHNGRYVMLYDFQYVWPWPHREEPTGTRKRRKLTAGAYAGDCRLAVSDDGLTFRRVRPDCPVIPMGEWGEWDDELLVLGGGSIIPFDDRVVLFYTALAHFAKGFLSQTRYNKCEMGTATLPANAFTYLHSKDGISQSTATTAAVDAPRAGRLTLHASHLRPYRDWIEVEVVDAATGKVVPGYSREDCRHVAMPGTAVDVGWGDQATLPATGAGLKLRFYLWGKARLYSFATEG